MTIALVLAAAVATAPTPTLEQVAAALRASPAWRADFAQTYSPEGFDQGVSERGELTVVPPLKLRFDYAFPSPRVFAVDGAVGRLVDAGNRSCEATRLDRGAWARLPLAAILDPAAAERAFAIEPAPGTLRLVPREPSPDVVEIVVGVGGDRLPRSVLVRDVSGNRNQFVLSNWRPIAAPGPSWFRPSLPGAQPCEPED